MSGEIMMDEALFTAEKAEDGIVVVRIKRHLIEHMSHLLEKECFFTFLDQITVDESIKCLIIYGNPDKRGSGEFEEWHNEVMELQNQKFSIQRVVNALQQHIKRVMNLPQIVLYGESGPMTTSYLSLGLAADYFAMTEQVTLENANAKFNILPAGAVGWLLEKRVGRSTALRMLLESEKVGASALKDMGVCDHVCASGTLEEHLMEKARGYASLSLDYLASAKASVRPNQTEFDQWLIEEGKLIGMNAYKNAREKSHSV